jgi:hypothetical protein
MKMLTIKPSFWAFDPPGAHSVYGPSSHKRWKACPASINLSRGIVIPDKSYNIRGTLCHEVAEALVRREYLAFPYTLPWQLTEILKKREKTDGDSDDILWVSRGAIEAVDYFVGMVGTVLHVLFEKRIHISGEMWGSADVIVIGTDACVVLDYKFGNSKVAADEIQLRDYLMGVFSHLENIPEHYRFIAGIYQPSVSIGYDEYTYSIYDMLDGLQSVEQDILETKQPNIYPNEGSHCFFCPASQTADPARKCPLIKMKLEDKAGASLMAALAEYESTNA